MIELTKDSTIYILCPSKWMTGGPEALHQLWYKLTNLWLDARMAYFPEIDGDPMPEVYKRYYPWIKFVFSEEIIDAKENLLIVPEVAIRYLDMFHLLQKSIWWLSVNSGERRIPWILYTSWVYCIWKLWEILGTKNKKYDFIKRLFFFWNSKIWKQYFPKNQEILHLYQSKYAENWILNKNGKHYLSPLSDYLNKEFVENAWFEIKQKENIVAYNPRKWFKYTSKLIKNNPDIAFVPIQNMTPLEVQSLLKKAKIYIDFWSHPWKDRIPREAALQGCCIITNTQWSARFHKDVPIPNEYVFESFDAKKIWEKIKEIFEEYELMNGDFAGYRAIIKNGENIFEQEVKDIFISNNSNNISA